MISPAVEENHLKCLHCGQDSLKNEFCCTGCAAAYSFIHQSGLDEFYKKLTSSLQPVAKTAFYNDQWSFEDVTRIDKDLLSAKFTVQNITCSACVWLLEKIPKLFSEIKSVRIDFNTKIANVVFAHSIDPNDVIKKFESLGFEAMLVRNDIKQLNLHKDLRQWYLWVAVSVASWFASMHIGLTLIAGALEGMDFHTTQGLGFISAIVALPAILYSAKPFYSGAWLALKHRVLTLDVLVSLSIVVGFALSVLNIIQGRNEYYFDAITMLIAFLLISRLIVRYLEINLSNQQQLLVKKLLLMDDRIKVGAKVNYKSGEKFTCDGIIVSGQSHMEASWLTGESESIPIAIGSRVYCGATNIGDLVEVECQSVGQETRVGKILSMLNSTDRSKFIEFSQKAESVFIGIVLVGLVAFSVVGLYYQTFDKNVVVALLLITCPCALGVAIPMTIATAILQAFKNGIFIKSASSIERLNEIEVIVFDKTGTLTNSKPKLKNEIWNVKRAEELGLTSEMSKLVLAAMLARSSHVMTEAIRSRYPYDFKKINLDSCKTIVGKGIEAIFNKTTFRLGSATFARNVATPVSSGGSFLYFTANNELIAEFELDLEISAEDIASIHKLNTNYSTYVLSGDSVGPVNKAAAAFGISSDKSLSQQTPEQKYNFVKNISNISLVLMIGDGVNDALAFKAAHVSIGVSGAAHAALEVSDIYLSKPGLKQLQTLFTASGKVKSMIVFNFIWAVLFNLVGIYFVLNGYLGPIVCAVLMPLSSAIVLGFAVTRNYFDSENIISAGAE